jgi:hypothetical protein
MMILTDKMFDKLDEFVREMIPDMRESGTSGAVVLLRLSEKGFRYNLLVLRMLTIF